jgi:hypothetical protein
MPDSTGQGISVGDATLEFLADTTQLDQGIDKLNAKVTAGMTASGVATEQFGQKLDAVGAEADVAGDAVEEGMGRATGSMREARGEAMLLGEAIGVRLPRHVTSFIATIPGVSEALQSAFAATAVLFILEAVVKLTEKVSDFISTTIIYTQTMKDADSATGILNASILRNEDALNKAKKALDEYGKSAHEIEKIRIADNLSEQLKQIEADLQKANSPLKEEPSFWKRAGYAAIEYFTGIDKNFEVTSQRYAAMKNNQAQADKAAEDARKAAALETKLADEKQEADEQKAIDKFEELQKKQIADYAWYAQQQILATGHAFNAILEGVQGLGAARNMPDMLLGMDFKDKFSQFEGAVKTLGITLREDLVTQLEASKKAYDELKASQQASDQEMKEAKLVVEQNQKALKDFDTEGQKSIATLLKMGLEIKKGKDDWQAFSTEMGSAMATALAAQQSVGAAAKAAVEQELEALSKKAAAQAIYYTGLGFAALAQWQFTSATQYFEAAGILGGIAVGSGLAAGAMGGGASGGAGGSGSGSMGSQQHQAIQTTGSTSQGTVTSTNVQHFAGGGLVSQRTLAMVGDSPNGGDARECVTSRQSRRDARDCRSYCTTSPESRRCKPHLQHAGSFLE